MDLGENRSGAVTGGVCVCNAVGRRRRRKTERRRRIPRPRVGSRRPLPPHSRWIYLFIYLRRGSAVVVHGRPPPPPPEVCENRRKSRRGRACVVARTARGPSRYGAICHDDDGVGEHVTRAARAASATEERGLVDDLGSSVRSRGIETFREL